MKVLIIFILLLSPTLLMGQVKYDAVWVFGDSTGIDFNNPLNPVPIQTGTNSVCENNGSISDENGNLLFYLNVSYNTLTTKTMHIMNRNDSIMENGNDIETRYSITQGNVILPSLTQPGP